MGKIQIRRVLKKDAECFYRVFAALDIYNMFAECICLTLGVYLFAECLPRTLGKI